MVSPETEPKAPAIAEKRATTLELFFDLVFVFAITQVSELIHEDLSLRGYARAALLMAMIWWAWQQFTWMANQVDVGLRYVRITILVTMGAVFVLSRGVIDAYHGGGLWVAGGYFFVRYAGMVLSWVGVRNSPRDLAALMTFLRTAWFPPLVILAGGIAPEETRAWWWLTGWVLEGLAAAGAGSGSWDIRADHFAERHDLILIIALGESIVAVGAASSSQGLSAELAGLLVLALAGTAAFWWSYFLQLSEWLQERLQAARGKARGRMARDVYSILHFPIISGIVLFAAAAKDVVAHPSDPLGNGAFGALLLGAGLFLGGQVASALRAGRTLLFWRAVGTIVMAVLWVAASDLSAATQFGLVTAVVAVVGSADSGMKTSEPSQEV